MVESGQGLGLAGEALGEGRVAADTRRQNLERHDSFQFLLPGLIDHAHAAAADEVEQFELGEERRQLRGRGWSPRGGSFRFGCNGFCFKRQRPQAARAQAFGRVGRHRHAAFWTFVIFVHHPLIKRQPEFVTPKATSQVSPNSPTR